MACGRHVLISDRVNVWREIAEAGAGLVGHDTVEGASATLARWFTSDGLARRNMAAAGRACFERRYTETQAAARLSEVIATTLARSTPVAASATLRAVP